ncbi:hypothetical protein INT45_000784 [Circinella minor]|uniref:Uncharacterized protein n=1 Tax=Circinella minor TaxID=1195481 RepID=A0A8H7RV76_9FUNG|nr:hypothetical protein INT45_000784 [Circinella minor]
MDVNKHVRNLAIGPYIDTVCGTTNNKGPSKYVYYVDDCNQDAAEIHGKLKKADMNAMIQDLRGVNGGELKRAMISYNRQNGRNVMINTSFKYGQQMWIGGNTFSSLIAHRETSRAAYIVRIELNVDVNLCKGKGSIDATGPQYYFGEIPFFMVHKQGQDKRILVPIYVYERPSIDPSSGSVYITSTSLKRLIIINPESINNFCGTLTYGTRSYFIWPRMISHHPVVMAMIHGAVKNIFISTFE